MLHIFTYCTFLYLYLTLNAQFCPLFVFYAEEFPSVLHARDQYIQQTFYAVTVLSDDVPVRPEIVVFIILS
jgi:hypothetical protein